MNLTSTSLNARNWKRIWLVVGNVIVILNLLHAAQLGIANMECVSPETGFLNRWQHTLQYKKQVQEIRHRRLSPNHYFY